LLKNSAYDLALKGRGFNPRRKCPENIIRLQADFDIAGLAARLNVVPFPVLWAARVFPQPV